MDFVSETMAARAVELSAGVRRKAEMLAQASGVPGEVVVGGKAKKT